jgi:hypothetical protein
LRPVKQPINPGKSGRIYFSYPYSEGAFYVRTLVDGEPKFVGNGTICIITPKNKDAINILYCKLNHDIHLIKEISIKEIDNAINNNYLIKMDKE